MRTEAKAGKRDARRRRQSWKDGEQSTKDGDVDRNGDTSI